MPPEETLDPYDTAESAAAAQMVQREGPATDDAPATVDWASAPIECLGVYGDTWWFLDAYRQIQPFPASRLSQRGALEALLGGDPTSWAATYFPEYNKEGEPTGDYAPRRVHKALARQMRKVGLFDPSTPRRGPGVWLHDGKPAVHCGDLVIFADGSRKPSFIRDGLAYIGAQRVQPPADGKDGRDAAGSGLLAEEVEAFFRQWNWENPASDRMLLGWLTLANLGALPPMRPLCMVDGQEGGGKSTLLECIAALSPAGEITNDTTEAGLRQRMNQRAAPMVLDEFEGEELVRVLSLLRRIVTGDGGRSLRGQGSQQALVTQVVGTAICGAIGAPLANAAETTRILRLMLWPRAPGVAVMDRAELLAEARKAAPKLWGRALGAWDRIVANAYNVKAALDKRGCSPRYQDMLGWLIAAREAMVADTPLTPPEAEAAVEWALDWVVTEAEQAEDTTAARCLQHLMAYPIQTGPGAMETVASLIEKALHEPGTHSERLLLEYGLRLAPYPIERKEQPRVGLYVASGRRPGLVRIYSQTEWQGGRWGTVLAQLRQHGSAGEVRAVVVKTRVRFSGENDRAQAVWLAPQLLPSQGKKGAGMD